MKSPFNIIAGGLNQVKQGIFGTGSPASQLSSPSEVIGETRAEGGVYAFHEGDLFTPGAGNWVLEPSQETPLATVWGHGFLRVPNTFNPLQPPQLYANPNVATNGIGGSIAGQMIFQPLMEPAPEQGG